MTAPAIFPNNAPWIIKNLPICVADAPRRMKIVANPSTNAAARMETCESVAFGRPLASMTDVPETNAR